MIKDASLNARREDERLARGLHQSERHGSRSRAPSVVCSWASATQGAQRCPDDKAQDILPVLCKNWVNGIDTTDSAVVPFSASWASV